MKWISFDPKEESKDSGSKVLQYKAAEGQILAWFVLVREGNPTSEQDSAYGDHSPSLRCSKEQRIQQI